jgi:hypothetical protein
MQAGSGEEWEWSGQFLEVTERWLQEPPAEVVARWEWPTLRYRLNEWRREIVEARELWQQERQDVLGWLHHYWQTIAEDTAEQVKLACETYHQFHIRVG